MGVLEQVTELKNKGMPENEIANRLREGGISPKEIDDAMGQSRIKNAVSTGNRQEGSVDQMEPSILRPERAEQLPTEGYLSDEDLEPPFPAEHFQPPKGPSTREMSEEEYNPQPQEQQESYSNYQYSDQQPQYQYSDQQYEYQPSDQSYGYGSTQQSSSDTDTLIEISEQVFSENLKPIRKQIEDINEFKALTQTKLENMSERLKRLEANIDKLQSAILERIGDYGRGLDSVKKEMEMMQDSFGKIVNTVVDKAKHHHNTQSHTTHKSHKTTHVIHHKKSSKPKSTKKKTTKKKNSKKK